MLVAVGVVAVGFAAGQADTEAVGGPRRIQRHHHCPTSMLPVPMDWWGRLVTKAIAAAAAVVVGS